MRYHQKHSDCSQLRLNHLLRVGREGLVALMGLLIVATAYELAVALGGIHLGSEPGEGPPGGGVVLVCALLAMPAGAVIVIYSGVRLAPLRALAGAAFPLARFYTSVPYYLPTLRRMSDHGFVSPWFVYGIVALALTAVAAGYRNEGVGRRLTVGVLLASPLLALVADAGH